MAVSVGTLRPRQLPRRDGLIAKGVTPEMLRQAYGMTGQRFIVHVSGGELFFYRYNDGAPADAIADETVKRDGEDVVIPGSQVIWDGGVNCASLAVWRSNVIEVIACGDDGVTHLMSRDGGETFMATNIAAGFDLVEHYHDDQDGQSVAMLYRESEKRWYVSVGTLNDANEMTFTAPVALPITGKNAVGSLKRRSDGTYEFAYLPEGSNTPRIVRCRELANDGTGDWA